MSGRHRTAKLWTSIAITAAAFMGPRITEANQPVHELQIVASRFAFEPSTIQVSAGEFVRLVVRSKDGTHGFAIPKLKIDLHVPASGDPVAVEFTAPVAGEYEIACSEFCGRGHGQMKATLVSTSVTRTSR
ncbi:MAG TPA: cupredoxin domain-containing protein [Vicinamibacterales bacterium]